MNGAEERRECRRFWVNSEAAAADGPVTNFSYSSPFRGEY